MKRKTLMNFRISENLKKVFATHCADHNITMTCLLNMMIEKQVATKQEIEKPISKKDERKYDAI